MAVAMRIGRTQSQRVEEGAAAAIKACVAAQYCSMVMAAANFSAALRFDSKS